MLLIWLAGTSLAADQTAKDAYDFAARTLKYVEASAKRPKLSTRLDALGARVEKTPDDASLKSEILGPRREIILSHPTLAFDSLLIEVDTPADIIIDHQRSLLYAPSYKSNKITIYKLHKAPPDRGK